KDFVAVDYSNQNAALNSITNAEARLSNGFSAITDDGYDLVVSNIPAKVGKEMLYLLLADAHRLLKPGGEITVVTVNGLRQFIKRQFNDIFGNYDKLKQGRVYTVARAVKSEC
ncbi:MAG: methyltransferase, partial [Gammaproteobacteria bacterium]